MKSSVFFTLNTIIFFYFNLLRVSEFSILTTNKTKFFFFTLDFVSYQQYFDIILTFITYSLTENKLI